MNFYDIILFVVGFSIAIILLVKGIQFFINYGDKIPWEKLRPIVSESIEEGRDFLKKNNITEKMMLDYVMIQIDKKVLNKSALFSKMEYNALVKKILRNFIAPRIKELYQEEENK